jgi:glycosyltransferase involved in cell wall biosynthesis
MFSFVVPTLERTRELEILFDSIAASRITEFEVIVVDQNRDGSLDDICLDYSKQFSLDHLKEEFKGAARARNYGARFASGTYLNFPDDDCVLRRDTLLAGPQNSEIRALLVSSQVKAASAVLVEALH